MSAEITTPVEDDVDIASTIAATSSAALADTVASDAPKVRKQVRVKRDGEDADDEDKDKPLRSPVSAELKKVMAAEDGDMRDVLDTIGTDGSFKISVSRKEPEQARDPATGRMVKVDGHLKTYTQKIDQEFIASRHGGGRFELKFLKKAADGSYKIHTKRVIDIAGDPRTDDVPRNIEPTSNSRDPVPQSGSGESPSIVKDVLSVMKDQLDKANDRATHVTSPNGPDPTMMMLLEEMRRTNQQQAAEMREMRKEAAEQRAVKPEKPEGDAFKDGLVKQLLDGDSTRLQAVRDRFESELRQAKDYALENERRLRDSFERERDKIEQSHQRELAFVKQSHEMQLAAFKSSLDTSKEVLNAQIKSLERENGTLRDEVKELRAKKEKGPLEIAKEMEVYQNVFGGKDDDNKDTADKIIDVLTNPAAIEFAQGIVGKKQPAPQQQPQQQVPQRPQIVRDRQSGETFAVRGNELVPVRKKGQKVAVGEGEQKAEVEIPAIDTQKLEMAISYLERAYSGNQDPEVVAQSAKPVLPEEILQSIQTLGIDVFFAKVAKLPSASPLSTQAGKNWIRKVGKALVGE